MVLSGDDVELVMAKQAGVAAFIGDPMGLIRISTRAEMKRREEKRREEKKREEKRDECVKSRC